MAHHRMGQADNDRRMTVNLDLGAWEFWIGQNISGSLAYLIMRYFWD